MTRFAALALAFLAASAVAGCGKKPSFVDPPAGLNPDPYPRMYPNPESERGVGSRVYPRPADASEMPAAPLPPPPPATDPFSRLYPDANTVVRP